MYNQTLDGFGAANFQAGVRSREKAIKLFKEKLLRLIASEVMALNPAQYKYMLKKVIWLGEINSPINTILQIKKDKEALVKAKQVAVEAKQFFIKAKEVYYSTKTSFSWETKSL